MEVIINNESKKKLKKGDAFGELALLYNAPRSASIKALSDCNMWGIDRTTFRKVVEEINLKEMEENKKFLSNVKFCCIFFNFFKVYLFSYIHFLENLTSE